jgi:hypothetical protein
VSGGEDGGAERAEGPPPGLRAGALVVPEPVEDVSAVEGVEAVAGAGEGGEVQGLDLVGGEGLVLGEQIEQGTVAGGEPG